MKFTPGQVVNLKSGGQAMTVVAVDKDVVECMWLGEEGDLFREAIPAVALELAYDCQNLAAQNDVEAPQIQDEAALAAGDDEEDEEEDEEDEDEEEDDEEDDEDDEQDEEDDEEDDEDEEGDEEEDEEARRQPQQDEPPAPGRRKRPVPA